MNEKKIMINGYPLSGDIIVDDPDCKLKILDMDIRGIRTPRQLKNHLKKYPEGLILMGYGTGFFKDPVPVSRHMIVFDEDGNADIRFTENAEEIKKQLIFIDDLAEEAQKEFMVIKDTDAN